MIVRAIARRGAYGATLIAALFVLADCGPKAAIEAAPKPRRPQAAAAEAPVDSGPTDCSEIDHNTLPNSLLYEERRVVEAQNLARDGVIKLQAAEKGVEKLEREALITDGVDLLIVALKADPYNVHATYNLAAAYARIGRERCSLNLLERMIDLRKLASMKKDVEDKLDRLFGRGVWSGKLDPDFNEMRGKKPFRELAKRMN